MSEQERFDRFDRARTRLVQAHQKALEACAGALDDRDNERPMGEVIQPLDALAPPNDSAPRAEEGLLYRAALEEVRTILEGVSEDARAILGEDDAGGG